MKSKQESLNFSMRRDHINPNSGSGGSQISQAISSKMNTSNENILMKTLNGSAKRSDNRPSKVSFQLDFKNIQCSHFANRNASVTSPCNMGVNDELNDSQREPNATLMSQQCKTYLRGTSRKKHSEQTNGASSINNQQYTNYQRTI